MKGGKEINKGKDRHGRRGDKNGIWKKGNSVNGKGKLTIWNGWKTT
jgi:hypothetical protein